MRPRELIANMESPVAKQANQSGLSGLKEETEMFGLDDTDQEEDYYTGNIDYTDYYRQDYFRQSSKIEWRK